MHHSIRIEVDPEGNFTYRPSLKRVNAGDTVEWVCAAGPFAVLMKAGSPFKDGVEATGPDAERPSAPLTVANVKGQYHYSVGVFSKGRVFLDSSCPVLVVN